jgi:hypothetical protein
VRYGGCIRIMRSFDIDGSEIDNGEGRAISGLAVLASKSRRWRDGARNEFGMATNDELLKTRRVG